MPTLKLDTTEFTKAAQLMLLYSRRSLGQLLEEQMRGFGRAAMEITPPARGGKKGLAAKKAGEAAIERDVRSVFIGTHPTKADVTSPAEMGRVLNQHRRGGRVRRGPSNKVKASRGGITALIRQRKKMVGWLAGGFATAMKVFNLKRVPAWIRRHTDAPGKGSLKSSPDKVVAEVVNSVDYAWDVFGLRRRVRLALKIQTRNMNKRIDYYIQRSAARSGMR